MNRRLLKSLLWIGIIALAVFSLKNVQRALAQDHVTDGSSVVLREEFTSANGASIHSAIYTFATRSDGSASSLPMSLDPQAHAPLRFVRLASGSQAVVSDAHQEKYTMPLHADADPAAPQNLRTPAGRCLMPAAKESASGEEQVSGYRAERVTAGNRTQWFALDYGCALVKSHFDWEDGSRSDQFLVMLRPGEPEESLFAVPDGYKEVPKETIYH